MQDMSEMRHNHGSICVDGVLYVLAGFTGPDGDESSSVESMPLESNEWTVCDPLPMSTCIPHVASIRTSIFLLDSLYSKRLFELNNNDNSRWMKRASLPASIHDSTISMCSVDDKLCVVGGRSRACVWYHPATDTWAEAQQKPRLQHLHGAAVVVSENVLLLGGQQFSDGTDESESLDVQEGKWSDANISLPRSLCGHHAVLLNVLK